MENNEKTVLVIDYSTSKLHTARKILNRTYHVILLRSLEDANIYLSNKIPNIIILNIKGLPIDELTALKLLEEKIRGKNVPIICIIENDVHELKYLQSGAFDIINTSYLSDKEKRDILLYKVSRALDAEDIKNQFDENKRRLEDEMRKQAEKMYETQKSVIKSMANIIESRDGSSGTHISRTSEYVELIVKTLKEQNQFSDMLTDKYCKDICDAAPLHDIGKVKISDIILQKPGKLTEEEFRIVKNHTIEGGKIIREAMCFPEEKEWVNTAIDMATYHHEKWDGTGYPISLEKEKIPLCARIMSVADVFDVLLTDRSYKKAMSLDEAFSVIAVSSGSQFDPIVVEAFLSRRRDVEKIYNSLEYY